MYNVVKKLIFFPNFPGKGNFRCIYVYFSASDQ